MLWKLHAQHVWFATELTRIRSPQDKPRVERAVQYVRGNFGAGESFTDLAEAQNRVEIWCREMAVMRVHGTTARRPVEMFAELEAGCLLPPPEPYDQPLHPGQGAPRLSRGSARTLYSVPGHLLGSSMDARVDSQRGSFPRLRAILTSEGGR